MDRMILKIDFNSTTAHIWLMTFGAAKRLGFPASLRQFFDMQKKGEGRGFCGSNAPSNSLSSDLLPDDASSRHQRPSDDLSRDPDRDDDRQTYCMEADDSTASLPLEVQQNPGNTLGDHADQKVTTDHEGEGQDE